MKYFDYCLIFISHKKKLSSIFLILGACALYLHCMALLKDMLLRIIPLTSALNKLNANQSVQCSDNLNQSAIEKLQQVSNFQYRFYFLLYFFFESLSLSSFLFK